MSKKRILIADDHSAVRRGVRNILSGSFPDAEFGEATDAAETLDMLRSSSWEVLILDIDFPGRSGLEVLKILKDENKKIPVLVFSFHREEQIALRALRSGASGYLSKDAADTELVDAIRQLLAGRKYISTLVSEQLVSQLQKPLDQAPHELLADREFQTLLLIAKGKSVSQIAEELQLSLSTVSTYRSRILQKMDMKNNAELTNYVYKNNLL
ncbi:MAG: response regulator [Flavisolibacter sp.]